MFSHVIKNNHTPSFSTPTFHLTGLLQCKDARMYARKQASKQEDINTRTFTSNAMLIWRGRECDDEAGGRRRVGRFFRGGRTTARPVVDVSIYNCNFVIAASVVFFVQCQWRWWSRCTGSSTTSASGNTVNIAQQQQQQLLQLLLAHVVSTCALIHKQKRHKIHEKKTAEFHDERRRRREEAS